MSPFLPCNGHEAQNGLLTYSSIVFTHVCVLSYTKELIHFSLVHSSNSSNKVQGTAWTEGAGHPRQTVTPGFPGQVRQAGRGPGMIASHPLGAGRMLSDIGPRAELGPNTSALTQRYSGCWTFDFIFFCLRSKI